MAAVVNCVGGCVGPGENDLWWNKSGGKKNTKFPVALNGTELVGRP